MDAIIAELAIEHAREAALLWSLLDAGPEDAEDEAALRTRITAHRQGMRICTARGADPLAGLDQPWSGTDLLPVTWMRPDVQADADDETGQRAHAAAREWP